MHTAHGIGNSSLQDRCIPSLASSESFENHSDKVGSLEIHLSGMVIAKLAAGGFKEQTMKKLIATVICLFVITMSAMPLAAQTRNRRYQNRTYSTRYDNRNVYRGRTYDPRYDNSVYNNDEYVYDDDYIYDDNRSVWDKHRDKITTAGGAVGGAALGGLIGGKKGAIIGAIAGGAGAAIYTYKIRDKYPRY